MLPGTNQLLEVRFTTYVLDLQENQNSDHIHLCELTPSNLIMKILDHDFSDVPPIDIR